MPKGIFVTGTDTGVGKTWITGNLAGVFNRKGLDTGVWKPVQSGALPGDPESDSYQLKYRSGVDEAEERIVPVSFKAPLAPLMAAYLEEKEIDFEMILDQGKEILNRHDFVLIEGIGGLAVPLTRNQLVVDLAARLTLPILIVSRPGLGTINHTLLTIEYARSRKLSVFGVIMNGYTGEVPSRISSFEEIEKRSEWSSEFTNPFLIEHFSGVPILGTVPKVPETSSLQEQLEIISSTVDVELMIESVILKETGNSKFESRFIT